MHVYQITYSLDGAIHTFSVMVENEAAAEAILEREHAGATLITLVQVV
jgi:hypothetical protein